MSLNIKAYLDGKNIIMVQTPTRITEDIMYKPHYNKKGKLSGMDLRRNPEILERYINYLKESDLLEIYESHVKILKENIDSIKFIMG